MNTFPQPLQAVADIFRTLPGLGEKSALRIALTLLKWPEEKTLAQGIPLGVELKYMDRETLKQSLEFRQAL